MATFSTLLAQVKASPIAGCVQPSEPYHQRSARTLAQWQALEDMGLVRLIAELDLDWQPGCDCDDPECPNANPESEAFGSVGQYRIPPYGSNGFSTSFHDQGQRWVNADSVWGHVGYRNVLDWRENAYIIGIMAETIDAFRLAWKDRVHHRCPTCHRP